MECREGPVLKWAGRKRRVPSGWIRSYYRANVGPLRKAQEVHHACGNPWCIELSHLRAMTFAEHRARHAVSRFALSFDGEYN